MATFDLALGPQVPAWMVNYTGDWKAMMDDHVTQICQHFAGSVQSWDG